MACGSRVLLRYGVSLRRGGIRGRWTSCSPASKQGGSQLRIVWVRQRKFHRFMFHDPVVCRPSGFCENGLPLSLGAEIIYCVRGASDTRLNAAVQIISSTTERLLGALRHAVTGRLPRVRRPPGLAAVVGRFHVQSYRRSALHFVQCDVSRGSTANRDSVMTTNPAMWGLRS